MMLTMKLFYRLSQAACTLQDALHPSDYEGSMLTARPHSSIRPLITVHDSYLSLSNIATNDLRPACMSSGAFPFRRNCRNAYMAGRMSLVGAGLTNIVFGTGSSTQGICSGGLVVGARCMWLGMPLATNVTIPCGIHQAAVNRSCWTREILSLSSLESDGPLQSFDCNALHLNFVMTYHRVTNLQALLGRSA